MEISFIALNRLRLKYKAEAGDRQAVIIRRILENPERLLGVILLGNTIANVAAASLLTYIVATYAPQEHSELISVLVSVALTLVILIFCELTPKIIAASHSEKVARRLLLPARMSIWLLHPFSHIAARLANFLVRLMGFSKTGSPFAIALSEDEIRALIAGSAGAGMEAEKKEMLHNIFEIGATQVREIMIPRGEVSAVAIDDPIPEILDLITKTNYSRIPVYRKSFDHIVGILYVRDMLPLLQKPGEINLQLILRPPHFVPDTARLQTVLRQFQSMHLHMAIIVDEFGGVEGIVTLEDLLEEIVGEIRDEHDTEAETVRELGPSLYSIAGNLAVRDFNRYFELKIPEAREYTTVAGFLQTRTGRLLKAGEVVHFKSLSFSIEKVEGLKIVSVRVRIPAVIATGTAVKLQ